MFEAADTSRSQDQTGAPGRAPTSADAAADAAAEPAPTLETPPAPASAPELSERDAAVLAFEKQWWKYAGAKEQAVRELFDLSATQYYQVLNTLLDSPAALAAEPMLVKRLRRMRTTRQRERTLRRSQL